MVSNLSKELQAKHSIRSMAVRQGDEVTVVRGRMATREGKVLAVYRKKFVIHIERVTREKVNGQVVQIGVDCSKVVITKLKMDKDRKKVIDRKARNASGDNKVMDGVD